MEVLVDLRRDVFGVPVSTFCAHHVTAIRCYTVKFCCRNATQKPNNCYAVTAVMAPKDADGGSPRVAANVPTWLKRVLEIEAHDRSSSQERVYIADVVREALEEWARHHMDELAEEARDELDEDLLANAGEP